MAKTNLAECPRCESTAGYAYSLRCLDHREGSWDGGGPASTREIETLQAIPKTVRCLACGARLPHPGGRPR